ncbi:MAG: glucose-6-phosphate dehydrogenase assembly protein OpcA [Chloroflexota bacterium]
MSASRDAPAPLAQTRVDLRAIERELTGLWQSAAESAVAGHSAPVTRTCLANLVVLTSDRAEARRATETIDRLTAVYPNRAIVAAALPDTHADRGGAPAIDAWVQAHCQIPAPGRPQVCGEQITIEAHGDAADHIPGIVLPLLVPAVPVALWLPRGEASAHPVAAKLADVADRLIVDSSTFTRGHASLTELVSLLDGDTSVSDLSWARLTIWRELVAQFFDAASMRRHLAEIERVRLGVPERPGEPLDRTAALLLAGWLAYRLGWSVVSGGAEMRLRGPGGAEVTVEVVAAPADDSGERLAEVTISCRQATFSVERVPGTDSALTRVEAEGMWPIARSVRMERLETAELLAGELRLLGRDAGFEGALRLAARLAGG